MHTVTMPNAPRTAAFGSVSVVCDAIRVVTCEDTDRPEIVERTTTDPKNRMWAIRKEGDTPPYVSELRPEVIWDNAPTSLEDHNKFRAVLKRYPQQWCRHVAVMISIDYLQRVADIPLNTSDAFAVQVEQPGSFRFDYLPHSVVGNYLHEIQKANEQEKLGHPMVIAVDGDTITSYCTCESHA